MIQLVVPASVVKHSVTSVGLALHPPHGVCCLQIGAYASVKYYYVAPERKRVAG